MPRRSTKSLVLGAAVLLTLGAGCIQFTGGGGGGLDGGVFRSADKGATWVQKAAVLSVGQPRTMAGLNVTALVQDPSDAKTFYAGTEQGLYYTFDGGDSWQLAGPVGRVRINAVSVSPSDKCNVYLTVANQVSRTGDCARTWTKVYFDPRSDVQITGVAVDFYNTSTVYASDNKGDFLKSADSGSSWSPVHRFENEIRQFLISSKDSRVIYVVTRNKGLWKTTDAGETWTDLSPNFGKFSGALDQLFVAESLSENDTLVASSNYGLLTTKDGGVTWNALTLLTAPGAAPIFALAVSQKDGQAIYYSTANTFYRTVDGGARWITGKVPTTRTITSLLVDRNDDAVLYAGLTQFKKN